MAIGLSPFWAPWVWKRIWPREYHAVAVMAILMVAIGLLIPTFISPFQFLWIIKAIGALVSIGLMFFGIVLYRDCFRLPV
ncbi:hypothetical protein HY409_03905 [Candidatus Gottesmanbacteria bacterium]|nr:hypothetical protein [Candidatus Gottesmanbacteria bacterium]